MKTSIFNFNRLGLLFRRYFIENSMQEIIYWIIMTVVFVFIHNLVPGMIITIFISGAFYAPIISKQIHSHTNSVAFFMIPATQLEKVIVGIVITSLYYFAEMMITYVIGNLLGTLINNILASINLFPLSIFHYSPLRWSLFTNASMVWVDGQPAVNYYGLFQIFMAFLFSQSMFYLGGIYFKKSQTFKTFLSFIAIGFSLSILTLIEIRLIFGSIVEYGNNINININFPNQDWWNVIKQIFTYLLIPFFWVVSYFRLTEKQI